ncbi:hypothetical protein OROMI_001463 [Orobanche minor]
MAPVELNSSGSGGATRDQASVKVSLKDPKKKDDKKDEDLSEEDLALKQLLELYVERVQDPDPGLQKTALEGMRSREQFMSDALKVLRLQAGHKYCLLGRLSSEVGWNHYDTIKKNWRRKGKTERMHHMRGRSS